MKRLALVAIIAMAAVSTSACITVIDADHDDTAWHGNNAQPFETARSECRDRVDSSSSAAFRDCMAEKGWTRS